MSVIPVGFGSSGSYSITNSARFNGASDYLSRTFTTGSTTKATISTWVKRSKLGATQVVFGDSANGQTIYFTTGDVLAFIVDATSSIATTAVYRDPSAWLHIVLQIDTTQSTASDRVKLWVNGTLTTLSGSFPGTTTTVNASGTKYIGWYAASQYHSGYLSEFVWVDGQALTPSSFGKTDSNGVWVPIKYAGTYGTNGFRLEFKNSGALGTDTSGNGNNWTVSGSPVQTTDTPTNNYATWNPIIPASWSQTPPTLSNGNTTASCGASWAICMSTVKIPTTGVYVVEFTATTVNSPYTWIGISSGDHTNVNYNYIRAYLPNATKRSDVTTSAYGASFTNGDVIGVVVDATNGTITFYKNGVSQGVAFSDLNSAMPAAGWVFYAEFYSSALTANFGATAMAYSYGTAKALCTANLPAVSIKTPDNHFQALTYTGDGNATKTLTTKFQPDLIWSKQRDLAWSHQLWDSVRGFGTTKSLHSNTTDDEASSDANATYGYVSSVGATSVNLVAGTNVGTNSYTNKLNGQYIEWLWKAGGAASSNTAGSITSQVSANTTAGMSVVTYTPAGANATVGHGLGAAPALIIVKQRSSPSRSWMVYHSAIGATKYLQLESTMAAATLSTIWNNTAPTSTVFSIGTDTTVSANGLNFVAYCFAEIPGYSKFGSYTGNGSADGTFVYCGFRPRWILIKNTATIDNWMLIDTARDTYNLSTGYLMPNQALVEQTNNGMDILSNGFKPRVSYASTNGANTIIFAAFAEYPFGGSNVAPSTAR